MVRRGKLTLLTVTALFIAMSVWTGCVAGPKDKVEVVCHYMTWFKFRENANNKIDISHWKWDGPHAKHDPLKSYNGKLRDVYSRFYPRIGIYDSGDPLVQDYHILTAKAAGITTFIIDWYNPGAPGDVAFRSLLDRCEKLNMKAAICYEEKTCFPDWNKISTRAQAVDKAVKDFKYLNEYFKRDGYWKKNGKPVILVFGGWGDWAHGKKLFTSEEWGRITADSKTDGWIVLQNYKENYPNIKAGFAWLGDAAYTKWFYRTGDIRLRDKKIDFYIGSVCPGFDDRGVWGWNNKPRFEAYLGLENFNRYLTDFDNSKCDTIQVVTWNDFAEGTMVEPTVQFGNLYLNRLGEWSAAKNGRKFSSVNTLLPYKWFYLAKSLGAGNADITKIKELLAVDKYAEADTMINALVKKNNIDIPPYISYDKEFNPYKTVEDAWHSDGYLRPDTDGSFKLVKRNYGSIDETKHRKLGKDFKIEIKSLSPGARYTVQLLMFDKDHKFIGSLDLHKSAKSGIIKVDFSGLKPQIKAGTAETAVKIWLEGREGSKINPDIR